MSSTLKSIAPQPVTVGVSSRLLDSETGAEVVRLGVAQRALLADQNVTLPRGTTRSTSRSTVRPPRSRRTQPSK